MLLQLQIENIAVIERADIELTLGFNVLTGETGAGKSILIDSINAVLGERTSKEIVRTGTKRAVVSAVFCDLKQTVISRLADLGIDLDEDGILTLQRELSADGRNICRINGRIYTVSILREVGNMLINIHGQHDNQDLLSPSAHIQFVDRFGGLEPLVLEYNQVYEKLCEIKSKLSQLDMDQDLKLRKIDLLKYQIDEIEQADLEIGEEEELLKEREIIKNAEKILIGISMAHDSLSGDEDSDGAISLLDSAVQALGKIVEYVDDLDQMSKRIEEISYELEEIKNDIRDMENNFEFDGGDINQIESRLDVIYKLKRKYGGSVEAVLDTLDKAQKELSDIEFSDEKIIQLNRELTLTLKEAETLAAALSEKRRETAALLSRRVQNELAYLDMPAVVFEARQHPCELKSNGADELEFLISANKGEPPKPITKIASGGELSRIMLAIKNVLADTDDVDTLIFDEIDTGVSGRAAQKIGQKLHEVSKGRQILCVTHLAQIAAQGDTHLLIEKQSDADKTYTHVTCLDYEGRKQELARIIGGASITQATLQTAEEMLTR